MSKCVNIIKVAEEAGRFGPPFPNFDEINLILENRRNENRPYEPPSDVIRRATAQLDHIEDYEITLGALNQIKRAYRS